MSKLAYFIYFINKHPVSFTSGQCHTCFWMAFRPTWRYISKWRLLSFALKTFHLCYLLHFFKLWLPLPPPPRSFSANLVQLFCTADKDQHHLPMVNVFRTFVPFPPWKFEKKWVTHNDKKLQRLIVVFFSSFQRFLKSWQVAIITVYTLGGLRR